MSELVVEIGAENIPASYIPPALRQLERDAAGLLADARLEHDEIAVMGTPRRLVLRVRGLSEKQRAAEEVVTGPPVNHAFDEDGAPTKAATGFARAQGVAVEKLQRIDSPRGPVLGLRRRLPTRRATTLLAERLPGMITGLTFPKTMKWEASGVRFARPIRWIVAMVDRTAVRFRVADVRSGKVTMGRPWMAAERVTLRTAGDYDRAMKKLGVIVDGETRRSRIVDLAERAAAKLGLAAVRDDDLIDELTYMVENPRVLVGEFDPAYLELPPEVITTAMRAHQRYIAVVDETGKLVPHFITFTDGVVSGPSVVRRGNEKVLRARLADAHFYWDEDVKHGIDHLAEELDRIVFIEGLGTVGQKSRRVGDLAVTLSAEGGMGAEIDGADIRAAAALAKADLASEMIKDGKEFTKLQGLIGSHYARVAGKGRHVSDAIRDHYQPRTPTDGVPSSALARVLGAADRIDTIVGCFLAGIVPTGSQDPYGLRRQANGLIRLIEDAPGIRINEACRGALASYERLKLVGDADKASVLSALDEFFTGRVQAFLKERGISYDVADAVTAVYWTRPGRALKVAEAVVKMRGDATFERLITGVKRVGNILPEGKRIYGADWESLERAFTDRGGVRQDARYDAGLFEDPPEKELLAAVQNTVQRLGAADGDDRYGRVLKALSELADPIDTYFDHVLVNCEDRRVRENRLNFLASVHALFSRYADFSYIVESADSV